MQGVLGQLNHALGWLIIRSHRLMKLTLVGFEGALGCNHSSATASSNLATRCLLEQSFFVDGQIRWFFIAWLVFDRVFSDPNLIRRHNTGTSV